jgi:hypothetical protein
MRRAHGVVRVGHEGPDLARGLGLHLGEEALGLLGLELVEDVRDLVGGHLLEDVRRLLVGHVLEQPDLGAGLELLEDVGRPLLVEGVEERDPRGVVEVFQDVGQVRGVDAVELGIGLGELDLGAREVDRLDLVPEDELAGQGLLEEPEQEGQGLGQAEPPEEPLEPHVDGDEVASPSGPESRTRSLTRTSLRPSTSTICLSRRCFLIYSRFSAGRAGSLTAEATTE